MILLGVAALAIGFAFGLRGDPAGGSGAATAQPGSVDTSVATGSQIQDGRRWRVASLETETVSVSAIEDDEIRTGSAAATGRSSVAERPPSVGGRLPFEERWGRASSFDDRWSATGLPHSFESAEIETPAFYLDGSPPGPRAHVAGRAVVGRTALAYAALPPSRPAEASRKAPLAADASAEPSTDSSAPPDADERTAIYDIAAHTVYLPDGRRLEAHSGLGSLLDDPRYVSAKDRGPTPPNVYDLSLREEMFHGVRALRLTPVGNGKMFGRDGILAHSYMLGANGQSNGCVSINNYQAFLNAYLNGEFNRLVVVEHLAGAPPSKTASGWIPHAIKALFERS